MVIRNCHNTCHMTSFSNLLHVVKSVACYAYLCATISALYLSYWHVCCELNCRRQNTFVVTKLHIVILIFSSHDVQIFKLHGLKMRSLTGIVVEIPWLWYYKRSPYVTTNVTWEYELRMETLRHMWVRWRQVWRRTQEGAIRKYQEKGKTDVKVRCLK